MKFLSKNKTPLGLALLGAITFIPFLGVVHLFDWDEINFAEISREMIVLEDYTRIYVNYLPFWQKPPLFFWLQVISMKIFGVNEFAARFPNALFGIITLPVIYLMGQKIRDHKFGLIWSLAYFGALLPSFYFQSGIIDPVFNFFIFTGLYFFVLFNWKKNSFEIELSKSKYFYLIIGGVLTGAAILTKGPVAFLILCLCFLVYWVYERFRMYINIPQFLLFTLSAIVVSLLWYGIETAINGPWFVTQFIKYNFLLFRTEDAGHGGFTGYHFVVIFFGTFPAAPFALKAFRKQEFPEKHQKDFKRWMLILLWVILILFSVVQSKIVHYSSMAYFPVTYLAALVIYEIAEGKSVINKWITFFIYATVGILGTVIFAIPFIGINIKKLIPLIDDVFVRGNLEANVHWTGFEGIGGLMLIAIAVVSIRWIKRQKIMQGFALLFIGTTLVMKITNVIITKKIEGYSQLAAIEFFEGLQGKDVYIQPVGHKTYAHYFYARMMPSTKPRIEDGGNSQQLMDWEGWLKTGDIDKTVYFSAKLDAIHMFDNHDDIDSLYSKNGFVFYKREPK